MISFFLTGIEEVIRVQTGNSYRKMENKEYVQDTFVDNLYYLQRLKITK